MPFTVPSLDSKTRLIHQKLGKRVVKPINKLIIFRLDIGGEDKGLVCENAAQT
jgi:hypothetical protein